MYFYFCKLEHNPLTCFRLEELRKFTLPTIVYSASLHPQKKHIVAGGEDFKLYKYDFETLEEQGNSFTRFNNMYDNTSTKYQLRE